MTAPETVARESARSQSQELLLSIESTCDETAAAVIERSGRVLGQCIATQETLHEQFNGVVPEIAARAHLERILPVIDTAMKQAGVMGKDLTAVAVADRPGLAGSLLVGVVAAKTLALAWNRPLISLNHLHAHLYACQLIDGAPEDIYPSLGLIVSGGHTSLYLCHTAIELEYLGGTIDDAAGEAFDKVAAMLSLPFPGGVEVAKLAAEGNEKAYSFPRSMIHDEADDFSFSGLKTAVRYAIAGPGRQDFSSLQIPEQVKRDVCASFEAAVVDVLVSKSRRAIKRHRDRSRAGRLIVGGGVAANQRLRRDLQAAADEDGFELLIAPPHLCTDNAVMGAIAWKKLEAGQFASLDLDITPGLQRGF
ncbi:tRNA (adenosine(37)-N6)-threonylcarbamoyltransferase complex transferase subunit TsaD [Rhodopirellula halodulae]|uniref:tRNA (adenosine(37)-N6)-threonylcarbamoyltransferase complex transferase subunit TsaD n=1 Tax=Rhodopirellula halodulae TaxID=2894198 RepID=UPI001E622E6D|nr:tRNA (adenosine(37)-N6)-threonylcarbamoyltransferase complex transferase subunit TsaD [Rhodopirellula sp. JC737]MCC9656980.1 tRNA (adenosine(37)-N6)-threonylcarbamoyltransferase complex transferase subunit TsaD [Rhodopirellula sp. JC737]